MGLESFGKKLNKILLAGTVAAGVAGSPEVPKGQEQSAVPSSEGFVPYEEAKISGKNRIITPGAVIAGQLKEMTGGRDGSILHDLPPDEQGNVLSKEPTS